MIFYNLSVDALSRLYLKLGVTVKGIVHPKMYILSSFTHPQVVHEWIHVIIWFWSAISMVMHCPILKWLSQDDFLGFNLSIDL